MVDRQMQAIYIKAMNTSSPHLRPIRRLARTMIFFAALQLCDGSLFSAEEDVKKQIEDLQRTVKELQDQVTKQKAILEDHGIKPGGAADFKNSPEFHSLRQDVNSALDAAKQKRPGLFNPSMSLALDSITRYSRNTGVDFIPRDIELTIQSNVDQYARAYAVFNAATELGLDERIRPFRRGENQNLGVEEAAIATTSLPWGLAVKGGQFFADFTRMGKVHPHERPFTDGPRSVDTIIGGETRARGFETTWLTPMEHYFRMTGGIVDGIGAEPMSANTLTMPDGTTRNAFVSTGYRGFGDLTYYVRGATMFELSPAANLHLGADYARNFESERRQLASADFKLEWKPDVKKNDLFTWGGEALYSRVEGNLPVDSFLGPAGAASAASGLPVNFANVAHANSLGGYSYAQYRIGKIWEPGLRFDVTMPQAFEFRDTDGDANAFELSKVRDQIRTYSAYIGIHLSEFNRLRLQMNYVDAQNDPSFNGGNAARGNFESDLQFFLQWTIILGPDRHDFQP